MSLNGVTAISVTMASGATLTGEIQFGRSFSRVYIDPTDANSEVRFQAAVAAGGTYRQVLLPQPATSTVQSNIWKVASAASGSMIEAPAGLRFMKIETTAAVANGATFTLICSD